MALYENIKKLIYCEPFDTKSGWNVLSKWLFFVCLVVVFGGFFLSNPNPRWLPLQNSMRK
jgi:hypothetical protein